MMTMPRASLVPIDFKTWVHRWRAAVVRRALVVGACVGVLLGVIVALAREIRRQRWLG